jgi:hypothetical protein
MLVYQCGFEQFTCGFCMDKGTRTRFAFQGNQTINLGEFPCINCQLPKPTDDKITRILRRQLKESYARIHTYLDTDI